MVSKSASILVPGTVCLVIGFLVFQVAGAALGLVAGFALGEHYYHHQELEAQVADLQGDEENS